MSRASGPLLPRVIGHRGAAASAPENTLESIRAAKQQGAGGVEFDAKLSADGVAFLFHDETLDRTSNGRGAFVAAAAADIAGLDAGSWFGAAWREAKVPLLADALRLVLELGLEANVEIKPCPGREVETARKVVRVIEDVWPRGRRLPVLSSFASASLEAAREAAPELPRGLLLWEKPADWAAQARALGCASIHCAEQYLTSGWAAEIKRAGYVLAVYTVNDPARAGELARWGADSIITDRPDAIRAAL